MNAALENGDTKQASAIIEDLLAVKIENYIAAGESKKDAETKAKSSIKSSLTSYWKDRYIAASPSEQVQIRRSLYATGVYDSVNDVIKMCNRWVTEARKKK